MTGEASWARSVSRLKVGEVAGWITFGATEHAGETVARAQVLMRASDPIYEIGLTLGGHRQENHFSPGSLRV
jgi:hypothetical protein